MTIRKIMIKMINMIRMIVMKVMIIMTTRKIMIKKDNNDSNAKND